ncbi:infB protein [Lactobacillus selangorensis]|uniref:Translation initiation factor IF-2 n=1 Tax=Lactobacillus selangorensis TaxID=81857 RepID=A0A0R2FM13_9LACO|nr:translation initiation factor IF-2 [Lactobacillus selangorensis]KRN29602.1 infB protein [Lactobacillus selangorensis]KRN33868.1 infB protein [Lactobacillus selangorensis]
MAKKRVYEFAKEMKVPSKTVLAAAKAQGITVKNHMSTIDVHEEQQLKTALQKHAAKQSTQAAPAPKKAAPKPASHPQTAHQPQAAAHTTQQNHPAAQHATQNHRAQSTQNHANNNHGQSTQNHVNNNAQNHQNHNNHSNNQHANNGQNHSNNQHSNNRNNNQHNGNQNHSNNRNQNGTQNRSTNNNNRNNQNHSNNRSQQNHSNVTASHNQTTNSTRSTARSAQDHPVRGNNNQHNNFRSRNNNNNRGRYGNNRYNKKNRKNRNQHRNEPKKQMPQRKDRPLPETLVYTVGMNAQDLGKILHREPAEIIKKLFMLGVMVNQNQSLDKDTIELLAADYGINAQEKVEEDISDLDKVFEEEEHNTQNQQPRPPVVTIMGHVDHGKTTLLDKLRHTHVTAGEAGGITQHIGAYQTRLDDRLVTFLDTPGHAAFSDMRARGAQITDIIVLVVAADDGVMPQAIEAINHAKAAKVPVIVAVNKIDKPGANPNHVMEQLTEYGLIPEDWGGDTIFVQISAKMGTNIDQLLEMILLEADVLELKANPDQKAVGTVIEARLDKGKGPIATLLVQQGTLHTGDPIVVGNTYGRVRVMANDHARRVKTAGPSMPVQITGLNDVPEAADKFVVFDDEKTARAAGEERAKKAQMEERSHTNSVTLDNLFDTMKEEQLKEVDVIIKADVQGSVEALKSSFEKIDVKGVRVNVIHAAVGGINESDVTLAAASHAIIIGFNVRPSANAKEQADADGVDIRLHNVIYNAIDEVESAMKGMLEPEYKEKVIGQLTVRQTYKVSKLGTIAGCYVDSGSVTSDSKVRLIRDGIVIYDGEVASLKRFKDDAKEVKKGNECGLMIANYNDIKVDDQLEAYIMEEVPVQ